MNSGAPSVDGAEDDAVDCRQTKNKRKNFSPRCSQMAPQLTIALTDEEKSPSPLPSQFCLISSEDGTTNAPPQPPPEVARLEFAMKTMQELLSMYGLSISPRDIVDALSKESHLRPAGPFAQFDLQQPPTPPETPNATPIGFQPPIPEVPEPPKPVETATSPPEAPDVPIEKKKTVTPTTGPLLGKYLKKFSSFLECGSERCQAENIRDHYHCFDTHCQGRCLSKKEEIIRHIKWHKKRSESLTHGFLRFSATDDCAAHFGTSCTHNRKQTHYHCLRTNCDKVYISTSDVQMHSNYHRKDSVIFQEGFQRFRATEECNTDYCAFARQRTTHFHCRRSGCRFTFKNKADMEKHKTYHIKDEQLTRDGFKKYLKSEACTFPSCRFSRVANHIHCTRENCSYVLHSSGQLISHKRKHERQENEVAYRRIKDEDGTQECPQEDFEQLMRVCTVTSCREASEPLNLTAHFHCACGATVDSSPTEIAQHMRSHEETPQAANLLQITSIDGFFNRKRGRPPKNRVVEVYNSVNVAQSPQAIFTSFKLEKGTRRSNDHTPDSNMAAIDSHFEFFDQTTDCYFTGCSNRKLLHHFHCTKCSFSFVSPTHAQTHVCDNRRRRRSSSSSASCGSTNSSGTSSAVPVKREPEEGHQSQFDDERVSVVRAAGTFFPENSDSSDPSEAKCGESLTTYCSRPFCKLKKKVHHHCDYCNQAFSEESRLTLHTIKHQMSRRTEDETPATTGQIPVGQMPIYPHTMMYKGFYPFLDIPRPEDIPSTSNFRGPLSIGPPPKQARIEDDVTRSCRMFKDEPIPQGYLKFRFNEDCKFSNCGYRNHQSHFHCCRHDCFYSFCDKTRFVQHTARHERLDKLMGDDFKQYRANMRCGYDSCAYSKATGSSNKSSHFHCLKCDFICSDTNKVVAHRRQHTKLEYIRLAGFRKVSNSENCLSPEADGATCSYSGRQTHYHCLVCNCSVLSRAQLTSHRHRE
ncbi:zinc finger protein castor homolog 1-like [Phlebotomus papatasi]|uniref:zinc finger protein castor homolog 1-like n=1 Tax=Phlebotomus papatasi TaxID=29031 RepID=UPI002483DFE3|nr:zinc finger protein castor homolog 1-like [Phlebotomus papatasi]